MRLLQQITRGTVTWLVLAAVTCLVICAHPASAFEDTEEGVTTTPLDLETRISVLIQQLGDPEYATRQQAKTELSRLRLEAFDALNEAQFHNDIEIALSARYLVRSMQAKWWTDEDPREVQDLLQQYGTHSEQERRNLMEQVAGLGTEMGRRPLCRLIRYETSERLSKNAALLTLHLPLAEDAASQSRFANQLLAMTGGSRRVAAAWARNYAQMLLAAPEARAQWQTLIAQEQAILADSPEKSSKELISGLLKWYSDQLSKLGRPEEAMAAMRETIDLLEAKYDELLEAADWLRKRDSWPVLIEMAKRFPDTFARNPLLQYRLALAYRKTDQNEAADEAAQTALKAAEADSQYHLELAANLQHDGLFEWAECEYRYAADRLEEEPNEALRAILYLSEMLHELGREKQAGQILEELTQLADTQPGIVKILENDLGRELGKIKSRMYFFLAQHQAMQENFQQQRELLEEGFQHYPRDADVLIAMHRVPDADPPWLETVRTRIKAAADIFRAELQEQTDRLRSGRTFEDRALAQFQLALINNQLAWLIANTEGDFDEALRCSINSLKLQPNRSGFLDTLGRCYYAKGDFENAVKSQRRAVLLEPYSPAILAQLELFEETLREQQATVKDENEAAVPIANP